MKLALITLLIPSVVARGELVVKVDQPKLTGQKALVKLTMKNNFKEKVESARAQVFLTDDQGEVVGQAPRWVIGGSNDRPALASNAETTFNFVLALQESTNLPRQSGASAGPPTHQLAAPKRSVGGSNNPPRPVAATNLTAKVTFNRPNLEGGKLAEPGRDVVVVSPGTSR
jgi:hypothetical protein